MTRGLTRSPCRAQSRLLENPVGSPRPRLGESVWARDEGAERLAQPGWALVPLQDVIFRLTLQMPAGGESRVWAGWARPLLPLSHHKPWTDGSPTEKKD